jgi:hypothetical protein
VGEQWKNFLDTFSWMTFEGTYANATKEEFNAPLSPFPFSPFPSYLPGILPIPAQT